MKMSHWVLTVVFSLGMTLAHADDATPPASAAPSGGMGAMHEKMHERCAADPAKCAEMKEKFKKEREEVHAACQKDPDHCKEIRAEHRKKMHDEWCAANSEQCEKMKARHEAMEKKCAADPKACEEHKEKMRERMKERHMQHDAAPAADTAAPAPAASPTPSN
jgi:hypothetical protein